MAGSRSLVACCLAVAAAVFAEDAEEVIGELFIGPARSEHPHWEPIHRERSAPQPYPPETDSWERRDTTLWTGIASFRDSRCGETLFNLFSKAQHPDRVTAGVVQQNLEGDEGCLSKYCKLMEEKKGRADCPYRESIRVLELDARDAQGPCWGRHFQSYLLAKEEFCLQIDSHMDFVDGWDTSMMEEWAATNNEYGVLSTYVQSFADLGQNLGGKWEVAHLCEVFFPGSGQPRNQQARAIHSMVAPKLTTTWGAGFSFSKCHAERRVPYDPHLEGIFDGEEFSKMVRLWTNGYDVYTPRRSHLVHDYSHPNDATTGSWRGNKDPNAKGLADQRLWNLMEMPRSTEGGRREVQGGPWGLGDRRTLDEFIEFTGVDLRTLGHIGESGDRCGSGVEWVPYALDGGRDGQKAFTSWRERKGVEPVTAGPHWADVKRKLEDTGVDVFWDLEPAPEARDAPAVNIDIDVDIVPDPSEDPSASEEEEEEAGGDSSGSADRGDDDGDGDSGEAGLEVGDGDSKVRGVGTGIEGDAPPPPVEGSVEEPAIIAAAAAAAAAAGAEKEGLSWKKLFVVSVSCVGMGYVACTGTRRRRNRRRSAKRRKQLMEWSSSAFSTHTLSPLGAAKATPSFGWKGALRSKHHQV